MDREVEPAGGATRGGVASGENRETGETGDQESRGEKRKAEEEMRKEDEEGDPGMDIDMVKKVLSRV